MLMLTISDASPNHPGLAFSYSRKIGMTLLQGSNRGDWPMFGYDAGHTGNVVANPHRIQGRLLWSEHLGPIFSSSVAGPDMLYVASTDGYLYALKQSTGMVIWRVQLGNYLTDA